MNVSGLQTQSSLASPFSTPFRALLWKEWRESRRQFAWCIVLLIVVPALLGKLYDLASGYSDSASMGMAVLALACGAPLAAGWGAHVVTRDLSLSRAEFGLARPISDRAQLVAKALVALSLFITVTLLDLAVIGFLYPKSIVEEFGGIEVVIRVIVSLLVVLNASFLAAVVIKRLVPAVLIGLVTIVFTIVVPMMLVGARPPLGIGLSFVWTAFALLAAAGTCLAAAWLIGWRGDRSPVSNRTIGWVTIVILLATTAVISNSLATNTTIVGKFGESALNVLGSNANSVYWIGVGRNGRGGDPTLNRTLFAPDGRELETKSLVLVGIDQGVDRVPHYDTDDFRMLIVTIVDRNSVPLELLKYPMDFNADAVRAERLADFTEQQLNQGDSPRYAWSPSIAWKLFDGNLYYPQIIPGPRTVIQCYEPTGGRPRLRSQTAPFASMGGRAVIANGHLVYTNGLLQRLEVDTTNSDDVRFSRTSDSLELGNQGMLILDFAQHIATRDDSLALLTGEGIRLYQLDSNGKWSELGRRRSTVLELLAGRNGWASIEMPFYLAWQGDHLFEITGFGLIVYDVSLPANPRRVAHVSGDITGVTEINDRHIAITRSGLLEVHRLP